LLHTLKTCTDKEVNGRTITIDDNTKWTLLDIDWIFNKKVLSKQEVLKLDHQNIII
jgi:hypothetical protein